MPVLSARADPTAPRRLAVWLARFGGRDDVAFAAEACTGWIDDVVVTSVLSFTVVTCITPVHSWNFLHRPSDTPAHEEHLAKRAAEEAQRGSRLRGRKPKAPQDKAGHKARKVNTTDPESGVMSTKKGFVQGYNAQAVANDEQVILSAEVTCEHNDLGLLHPMIEATDTSLAEAGIEERPENLLADAGYASEENFAALDDEDPDCYVATRNMKKNPEPRTGRRGPLKKDATLVDRMDRKVSTKKGNTLYRRRQAMIEPVFGQIKQARGIRGFSRRGKNGADSEWKLICGTHNLLKLYRRALADPTAAPFSRMGAAATA